MQAETSERLLFHLGGVLAGLLEASGISLENPLPPLLATKDAAKYVGVGETKLRQLTAAGEIPSPIQLGGRPKYVREELDAFVRREIRRQRESLTSKRTKRT
ncbi:MAG: helix-turn-helix domain-containing protein [Planctomycetota bacterium]